MALDLYFKDDIARALAGLNIAAEGMAALVLEEGLARYRLDQLSDKNLVYVARVYRRGFRDALCAVAAAFGAVPDCVDKSD